MLDVNYSMLVKTSFLVWSTLLFISVLSKYVSHTMICSNYTTLCQLMNVVCAIFSPSILQFCVNNLITNSMVFRFQPVRWSQRVSPARRWPSWGSSGSWTCTRRHRQAWRLSSWRRRRAHTRGTPRADREMPCPHPPRPRRPSPQSPERTRRSCRIRTRPTCTSASAHRRNRRRPTTRSGRALPLASCLRRRHRIRRPCP